MLPEGTCGEIVPWKRVGGHAYLHEEGTIIPGDLKAPPAIAFPTYVHALERTCSDVGSAYVSHLHARGSCLPAISLEQRDQRGGEHAHAIDPAKFHDEFSSGSRRPARNSLPGPAIRSRRSSCRWQAYRQGPGLVEADQLLSGDACGDLRLERFRPQRASATVAAGGSLRADQVAVFAG